MVNEQGDNYCTKLGILLKENKCLEKMHYILNISAINYFIYFYINYVGYNKDKIIIRVKYKYFSDYCFCCQ